MVDGQLRTFGVTDRAILAAFAKIPREKFVEPSFASFAYLDRSVPALKGAGRLLIPPMTLARLIQAAEAQPGDKALEIASGSGYGAAIMAEIGASVIAVETAAASEGLKALLGDESRVHIVIGDLAAGAPARQPYDIILLNGAFETIPDALLEQLAEGGRLVGVDASFPAPKAALFERIGGATSRRTLFDASAPKLEAFQRRPQFAF